jgi:hypothetical protein
MDRSFNIEISGDSSSAVSAARETSSALGSAADEASRYEARLRQMEIASKAAEQAQRNLAAASAAASDLPAGSATWAAPVVIDHKAITIAGHASGTWITNSLNGGIGSGTNDGTATLFTIHGTTNGLTRLTGLKITVNGSNVTALDFENAQDADYLVNGVNVVWSEKPGYSASGEDDAPAPRQGSVLRMNVGAVRFW